MLAVGVPVARVVGDVLANAVHGVLVTNDVVVVIALPDGGNGGLARALYCACDPGLEAAHDITEGWCGAQVAVGLGLLGDLT